MDPNVFYPGLSHTGHSSNSFALKNWFLSSWQFIWLFIPDPDPVFLTHPEPDPYVGT
jgi:hypothetical protein